MASFSPKPKSFWENVKQGMADEWDTTLGPVASAIEEAPAVATAYYGGDPNALNPHVEPPSTGRVASEAAFPKLAEGETDPLWSNVPSIGPFAGARSAFEKQTPIRSVAKGLTESGAGMVTDPATMSLMAAGIENPIAKLAFKGQMIHGAGQHVAQIVDKAREKGWTDPETIEEIGKAAPDVIMALLPSGLGGKEEAPSKVEAPEAPEVPKDEMDKVIKSQMAQPVEAPEPPKAAAPKVTDTKDSDLVKKQRALVQAAGIEDHPFFTKPTEAEGPKAEDYGHRSEAVARTEHDIIPLAKDVEKWPSYKEAEEHVDEAVGDLAPIIKSDIIPESQESKPGGSELVHGVLGSRTEATGKVRVNLVEAAINSNSPEQFAKLVRDTVGHELAHPARPHGNRQVGTDSDGNPYIMDSNGNVAIVPRETAKTWEYSERAKYDPDEAAFNNAHDAIIHHPKVVDRLNKLESDLAKSRLYDELNATLVPDEYRVTSESKVLERPGYMSEAPPDKVAKFAASQERKYGKDWRLKQTAQEADFYDRIQKETPKPTHIFDKTLKEGDGSSTRYALSTEGIMRIEKYDKDGNILAAHEGPDMEHMEPVEIAPADLSPAIPSQSTGGGSGAPPSEPPGEEPPSEEPPEEEGPKRFFRVRLSNGEYIRTRAGSEEDAINTINEQLEKLDMTHVSAEEAIGLLTPLERAAMGEGKFEQEMKDTSGVTGKVEAGAAAAEKSDFQKHIESQADRIKLEEQLEAVQAKEELRKLNAEIKAREQGEEKPGEKAPREKSTLSKIADVVSGSKRSVMSTGIPKTGISPHGFSLAARQVLQANPLEAPGEAIEALKRMVSPDYAQKQMLQKYPPAEIQRMQSLGLLRGLEDYTAPIPKPETPWAEVKNIHKTLFEEPLFGKYAPSIEADVFSRREAELKAAGLPPDQATAQAVKDAQTAVGNVKMFAKDGTMNDLARIVLFAPQWLASHGRIAAGMVNVLMNPNDPRGRMYRNIMVNFAALTMAKEALSYALNGKSTFANVMGHKTDIKTGSDETGKDVYVRPEANAMDAFRLPFEVADAIQNDPKKVAQIVDSHIAPMTRAFGHLAFNTDHFGNRIYGTGKPGSDQARAIINELAGMTPSWMQAAAKAAEHAGGQNVKPPSKGELAVKAVGLPMSFTSDKGQGSTHRRGTQVIH